MQGFTAPERRLFRSLRTPQKIQDYLDTLPINHEKGGETCYSPLTVIREKKAHCLEGALLGAAALAARGARPLLVNLRSMNGDDDHAVALFQRGGRWGALSKTNHAVLRYRDPVYRTVHELVLSYFHEYFLSDGKKTLRTYSRPLDLRRFGEAWVESEDELWHIAYALWDAPHLPIIPEPLKRHIRNASPFERSIVETTEWSERDPRT